MVRVNDMSQFLILKNIKNLSPVTYICGKLSLITKK